MKKDSDYAWLKDVSSVPLQQPLKIRWPRSFTGKPSSLTISKNNAGQYFVSILVKKEVQQLAVVSKTIGVDVRIADLAVCSDGQRKLTKKKKGSNRYG